ncbi:efflux RND transporter periplasmic adaptor subunit [Desulfobacca acetoxidans]|uniref:Efflux transporter, RND family, MFP subunit n=1 Tax=Desulfobacca acetoxidans (strain ATCC 700848 / DSM 11109 / ASRB2) TaxID=880072 RepID=F2NC59_DESAR|nr:efflux RND transporter periplasmic adaptor subunit [Desulfobacca acetoxidans]AEB08854.1 efflux transporter, RND family, MFP subunit [Desulfobacca acetoxidans DSM 11109]
MWKLLPSGKALWKNKFIAIAVVAVIILLTSIWVWRADKQDSLSYSFAVVNRGDLQATITATGTVEPEELVDVGAQVAGKITVFGKDKSGKTVDYGSVVEAGAILAKIDDAIYAAEAAQAKAQLAQAKANVQRAEAELGQLRAKFLQAERDWVRARKLGPSDALSESDYDAAQSAFEVAKANVDVGRATLLQAKEGVAQSEAALSRASQNLDYCTIKAPVNGVIIDRRVNIGQTVVASLNAPSLFLIAKDLTRLQIWAPVNEADIGNIHPGQPVTFVVDAYPRDTFKGVVGKVRLNATMTQNVVTYTVEVNTDNAEQKLIPYLTANVRFLVAKRQNVLLVPNAALRWRPQLAQIAPDFRQQYQKDESTGVLRTASAKAKKEEWGVGTLWVPKGAYIQPMEVRLGPSDGTFTEVQGPGLQEGLKVVAGEKRLADEENSSGSPSPFTPKLFGGKAPRPH